MGKNYFDNSFTEQTDFDITGKRGFSESQSAPKNQWFDIKKIANWVIDSKKALNPDNIVLNKAYTDAQAATLTVGAIFYNSDQLCWMLKTSANTYLNFGEELTFISKNGDGSPHLEGTAVYTTSGSGNLPVLRRTNSTIGICNALATEDVSNTGNTRGNYCYNGQVRTFPWSNVKKSTDDESTWVEGADLYLCSEDGKYSTTKEAAPAKAMKIGRIMTRAGANISVLFQPVAIHALEDLSNIDGSETTMADTDTLLKKVGNVWKTITQSNFVIALKAVFGYKLYHGLESCGAPSFDNSTHILTIATETTYWYKGTKKVNTGATTCDIDSFETLTANTLYYFYFDDTSGTLKCSDSAWSLKENIPTFMVWWNGSEGAILIEKHNHTRDIDWHIFSHNTIGARYGAGLSLTNPTTTNDALLQIEAGNIFDEDQNIQISQQTTCRGIYKVSASVYTFANYSLPYVGTSGQPQWLDTDDHTLKNVAATDFVNMWVYANNDYSRAIWIHPTHAATAFNTLALARAETPPNLTGLNLTPELKLIYKFTYKGDGQFQESVDYRNSSSLPAGGTPASSAASVTETVSGNVQAALDSIRANYRLQIACSDISTALTAGTKKATFIAPFDFTLIGVIGFLDTVCTGSTFIIDINKNGTSVLSTKLSIDASENTSLTAATAAVISTNSFTKGDIITIDFDQVGATIPGAGCTVTLEIYKA